MSTLKTFVILSFFLFHREGSASVSCKESSCTQSDQTIRFPFRLNPTQPARCGYPGFDLSCNNHGQTSINLPSAGEFVVDTIDYWASLLIIRDPESCMPKRWLNYNSQPPSFGYFSLSSDYYNFTNYISYTFLNCTPNVTNVKNNPFTSISCLSGDTYTVSALPTNEYLSKYIHTPCSVVSSDVQVLNPRYEMDTLFADIWLSWGIPDCRDCEDSGGSCRFKSDTGYEIGCTYPSRIVQHCITAAMVVGSVLCFCGLMLHIYIRGRVESRAIRDGPIELGPVGAKAGLDRLVVDSYPKTVFGEGEDSPSPNDSACAICICEYQTGDVLRIIPNCKHYFHVTCIDPWLLKKATCPLCRNLNLVSTLVTPTSSSMMQP